MLFTLLLFVGAQETAKQLDEAVSKVEGFSGVVLVVRKKVLSKEAKNKLWTPALENYACGWYVFKSDRGTQVIAHTGSTVGFDAGYYRFVDEETVVIALANHEGKAAAVTPKIRTVLFPGK